MVSRGFCTAAAVLAVAVGQCLAFPGMTGSGHSYSTRRNLLQTRPEGCGFEVGATSTQYGACTTLGAGELPDSYNLYYSYDAATRVASVAFEYPNPEGWVAFGVPEQPGVMVGASAVIAKADATAPTGASIDQYFLEGYQSSSVQPPGKLSVNSMEAAVVDGSVRGAFEMELPAGTDASAVPFIYTFGPLSADGSLQMHVVPHGLSDTVDLQSATAPAAGSTAATPAATPVAETPASAPATPPAAEMPAPAPQSDGMAAAAPGPMAGNSLNVATTGASCSVTLGGTQETFSSCTTLSGTPGGYAFMWRLDGRTLRGAIDGEMTDGYIGWGQGTGGRQMVPGNGIIVSTDSAAASGASVGHYALNGYSSSDVTQPSAWNVTNLQAASSGGRLLAAFTLELNPTQAAEMSAFNIIYTKGPIADGVLQPHDPSNGNTATLDLTSGSVSGERSVGNDRRSGSLPTVHGWLAAVGLGLGLPLAAACARTLKQFPNGWFHAHRAIALVAYLCGVAAIGIGLYMRPMVGAAEKTHEVMGLIALGLGFLQTTAIAARPTPTHRLRKAWALVHHNVGRLTVTTVIANVYLGISMSEHIASDDRKNWYIVYSVFLVLIIALAVAKEANNYVTKKPPYGKGAQPMGTTASKGSEAAHPYSLGNAAV